MKTKLKKYVTHDFILNSWACNGKVHRKMGLESSAIFSVGLGSYRRISMDCDIIS